MTLSRGIDVSHHQGRVDWGLMRRNLALTWGACKASEGTSFVDSEFADNWAGMKAAGLARIAYHFARPGADVHAQVDKFLTVVRPAAGDVLCLDLEQSDSQSPEAINAWARTFGAAIRATGCTTVLYIGGYSANRTGTGLSQAFDYWWYPRYATNNPVTAWPTTFSPHLSGNTTGWATPHIWQWADSLSTAHMLVDANVSTLTADQLRAGTHAPTQSGSSIPNLTPPSSEVEVVTDQDRAAIASDVVQALLTAGIGRSGVNVAQALERTDPAFLLTTNVGRSGLNVGQSLQRAAAPTDPALLAAQIATHLNGTSAADVESALRAVFADAATPDQAAQ